MDPACENNLLMLEYQQQLKMQQHQEQLLIQQQQLQQQQQQQQQQQLHPAHVSQCPGNPAGQIFAQQQMDDLSQQLLAMSVEQQPQAVTVMDDDRSAYFQSDPQTLKRTDPVYASMASHTAPVCPSSSSAPSASSSSSNISSVSSSFEDFPNLAKHQVTSTAGQNVQEEGRNALKSR